MNHTESMADPTSFDRDDVTPLAALRHHVTGAIERGEAQAVVEVKPLTRQQLFDNALMGIRAQGHRASVMDDDRSGNEVACVYISANGDRCAVGHSIPAGITSDMLEAKKVNEWAGPSELARAFESVAAVLNLDENGQFVVDLQKIHDALHKDWNDGTGTAGPAISAFEFEDRMRHFATKHGLTYTARTAIAA